MERLITVGVPVYKGADLPETLYSIQAQTHKHLEVIISVDGGDDQSVDVCKGFLKDNRFRLSRQNSRLDWAGNTNWLIQRASGEYFCYFQQDDLADPSYLEKLRSTLDQSTSACAAYSDLRWFGAISGFVHEEPLVGTPFERVGKHVEQLGWIPMQGLVRTTAIRQVGSLRVTEFRSCLEEQVLIAKLACIGQVTCVPECLYFKRNHSSATHREWHGWHPQQRLDAWIVCLAGLAQAALSVASSSSERAAMLSALLDRLLKKREGRWMFYETDELRPEQLRDVTQHFLRRLQAYGCDLSGIIGSGWRHIISNMLHSYDVPPLEML